MKVTCAAVFALCVFQTAAAFQAAPAFHRPNAASRTALGVAGGAGPAVPGGPGAPGGGPGKYSSDMVMQKSEVASGSNASRGIRRGDKNAILVQGGSLKTWSIANNNVDRVLVEMGTEGRPLDADIELWQGPDNTPHKMRVYLEDGSMRPFKGLIETPRGPNAVCIRNIGQLEFPLLASVNPDTNAEPIDTMDTSPLIIQGGALRTYPCESNIESVQVLLTTDGRPLSARIELLQGPNNIKQIIEVYTEDGMDRPFYTIIESPGSGNVVRVVNTATVEFPMTAWVEPLVIGEGVDDIVISDDQSGGFQSQRQGF